MRECQRWVDSREFTEWMLFDETDPIGMDRFDVACAGISHTIAAVNRGKGGRRPKVSDFVIQYGNRKKQSQESMLAVMEQAKQLMAGKPGNNGN